MHRRSTRAGKPLIKVNCAAVPRELYESEFFGHAKGAFTGALRDPGGFVTGRAFLSRRPLAWGFSPSATYTYNRTDSNIAFYRSDRHRMRLGLLRRF